MSTTTFVLVHGAWHGGWCWGRVRPLLEAEGHRVLTPTQTGLGERAHLLSPAIDLELFAEDIARVFLMEDLSDVVLVGHSFAGAAITGLADRMPERLRQLVYLDALIVESGETPMSRVPAEVAEQRMAASRAFDGGLSMPVPPPEAFGVTRPEDIGWIGDRLVPHPLRTFMSALTLANPIGNGVPATYIACTEPWYGPLASSRERARALGWPMREIATGHDAMVTAPGGLARLLTDIAGRQAG
jgi:pimeloyl-ACP methyl ester carboxylesterase